MDHKERSGNGTGMSASTTVSSDTDETSEGVLDKSLKVLANRQLREFKRYPAYKDSGVGWLREIPTHWSISRISEVARVINGFPFDSQYFVFDGGLPLVRIRDLNAKRTEIGYRGPLMQDAWIEFGDVIVGMDGDFNIARWRGERALLNQRMCCLRPRSGTDPQLVYYALSFPLKAINDLTYATTVKHLSSIDVRKIRVGLPSNTEQCAIAAFLIRETSKIDVLVAKKEQLVELLQEARNSLITRAVTQGLDPDVPMEDTGAEWLGKIPAHWAVKPLKAVSSLQTGLTLGKNYDGLSVVTRPYLRVANVQDGYLALEDVAEVALPANDARRYELRVGDVLMTEGGDFDKLGRGHIWSGQIAQCVHQNHIFAVRPSHEALNPRYLSLVMGSGYGRAYFTATSKQSTNLASTNSTKLRNLPMPLPDISEQDHIVVELERQMSRIDSLVANVCTAIARAKELRTSLIYAAVTGKIDVREEVA
jgi:type I restriction enzyme S subunit